MRLDIKLKTVGLFCVGWSHPAVTGPDIQFVRRVNYDGSSQVYIPASSFKGALRSSASRIAESYGFKSCGGVRPEHIREKHTKMGRTCDVCEIFGHPWSASASPLMFSDLLPTGPIETTSLTRIRIGDKSMRAAEGALFSMEYVPPGCEFAGTIELMNVPKDKIALLLLSMAELRLGRIGRGGPLDLKIERADDLKQVLRGTEWLALFHELEEWLWHEVP
ncbi:MAG: RAMP superfamily CRISPR-associated protein [Candidatus Nezhaarchaeales archaeon]